MTRAPRRSTALPWRHSAKTEIINDLVLPNCKQGYVVGEAEARVVPLGDYFIFERIEYLKGKVHNFNQEDCFDEMNTTNQVSTILELSKEKLMGATKGTVTFVAAYFLFTELVSQKQDQDSL